MKAGLVFTEASAVEALGVDPDYQMWLEQYAWAVDRRSQIKALNQK